MTKTENSMLAVWRELVASPAVREQQVAFTCVTGVPLTLAPAGDPAVEEGTFCVKGCLGGHSGELCQEKLLKAERRAISQSGPVQYSCPSGLVKILVPVFIHGRHAGTLLAGPMALRALNAGRLARLTRRLEGAGLGGREAALAKTWQFTPRLTSAKCRAAGTLLQMFGKYLEATGRRMQHPQAGGDSALLKKIEAFLAENKDAQVSLKEVAARVNLSPCHFCSVFKKQTGVTFSQYRLRQRLEKAREMLAGGAGRVSDVAFEAGFESIPYFNRAFRKQYGCSPTAYRARQLGEIQVN